MDSRGQVNLLGFILGAFVAIIVALAIFTGGVTTNVGRLTNTVTLNQNTTVTSPAAGSSTQIYTGIQAVSGCKVTNASTMENVPASNYTITNYETYNGELGVKYAAKAGNYVSIPINISCSYGEPTGYVTDGGGRTMVSLITIFAALSIAVVSLKMAYDRGLFDVFTISK